VSAYASSREVYASAERGYDVTGTLVSGGASTTLTIPHYTFGDQVSTARLPVHTHAVAVGD
jgi:hypothetical protein